MRRLAGRFTDVVGFDRKAPKPPPPGCVYIPVEITSEESVREGLRTIREHHGAHVASVIHLAAYYDFFGKPSSKYEEITVQGTGRLLRGLRELDFQVEQFIFSSTMLVHRPGEPGELITEDSPIEATWAYPGRGATPFLRGRFTAGICSSRRRRSGRSASEPSVGPSATTTSTSTPFSFLSNHYHLLISVDDAEQMARFVGYFQSKLARELARLTNWREKIWGRRYSAIPVSHEEAAQVGRLDYILSQGVKEGLVFHPADWPGAHSVEALLYGTPLEGTWYDRTAEYRARVQHKSFDPEEFAEPETVEISPLPCWQRRPTAWIRRTVEQRIEEIVDEARTDKARYRKLLAAARPTDRPQRVKRSPAPWFHCASRGGAQGVDAGLWGVPGGL